MIYTISIKIIIIIVLDGSCFYLKKVAITQILNITRLKIAFTRFFGYKLKK
jgi:hypothetical protein